MAAQEEAGWVAQVEEGWAAAAEEGWGWVEARETAEED